MVVAGGGGRTRVVRRWNGAGHQLGHRGRERIGWVGRRAVCGWLPGGVRRRCWGRRCCWSLVWHVCSRCSVGVGRCKRVGLRYARCWCRRATCGAWRGLTMPAGGQLCDCGRRVRAPDGACPVVGDWGAWRRRSGRLAASGGACQRLSRRLSARMPTGAPKHMGSRVAWPAEAACRVSGRSVRMRICGRGENRLLLVQSPSGHFGSAICMGTHRAGSVKRIRGGRAHSTAAASAWWTWACAA